MEDSYNNAPTDANGYALEQGGTCWQDHCEGGKDATIDAVTVGGFPNPLFDWHTHGNVGKAVPGGKDSYVSGASRADSNTTRGLSEGGLEHPSYIIDDTHVYKVTADKAGHVTVRTFDRFVKPKEDE